LPRLMSVPSAARVLGIGTTLLFRLIKSHDIAVVRLGRRSLVPLEEIERIVAFAGRGKAAS
jgi:excisionase family DNA binding protein